MISEIIKQRLKEGKGYKAKIFLKNTNYPYIGIIGKSDDKYLEIYLDNNGGLKIIDIELISEVMVYDLNTGDETKK